MLDLEAFQRASDSLTLAADKLDARALHRPGVGMCAVLERCEQRGKTVRRGCYDALPTRNGQRDDVQGGPQRPKTGTGQAFSGQQTAEVVTDSAHTCAVTGVIRLETHMGPCKLDSCDERARKRSRFCSPDHRDEYRRVANRERMRRNRAAEAEGILDGAIAASDGRSLPGQSADARSATTQHHPSRKFAREELPELVDLTLPGATDRGYQTNRVLQRQHVQRYTPPGAEQDSWAPQGEDYYGGVTFPRNDMSQGPYQGGYVPPGFPVAFEVRRVSR